MRARPRPDLVAGILDVICHHRTWASCAASTAPSDYPPSAERNDSCEHRPTARLDFGVSPALFTRRCSTSCARPSTLRPSGRFNTALPGTCDMANPLNISSPGSKHASEDMPPYVESPTSSSVSDNSCVDTLAGTVYGQSSSSTPSTLQREGRSKRERKAPKIFAIEEPVIKRRATSTKKPPARDSGGRFIKRRKGKVSPASAPKSKRADVPAPPRDSKGRFLNPTSRLNQHSVPVSLPLQGCSVTGNPHVLQYYATNFVDSILNLPAEMEEHQANPLASYLGHNDLFLQAGSQQSSMSTDEIHLVPKSCADSASLAFGGYPPADLASNCLLPGLECGLSSDELGPLVTDFAEASW